MWFRPVLVIVFGIATSERPFSPPQDDAEGEDDDADASTHVMLEKLKDFYHPQYGDVHQTLNNIAKAQEDSTSAAQTWTGDSFQALKEAHMIMTKSTQDTQNVLMSDTMRVNEAVRENFRDEMAKIDAVSLDASARKKIIKEKGLSVVMPPGEFENDFNGRRIRANTRYNRENAGLVHSRDGTLENFVREEDCWKVKFDDTAAHPNNWKPCLKAGEFEFITETADAKAIRKHTPVIHGPGQAGHMGAFAEDPYVIVDHIPLSITPRVAGKLWLHHICKIVSWDSARNAYKVKRPLDPDNYMSSIYSDEALFLLPSRDFHSFHDIAGQKVQITHFQEAKQGLPGEAFFGRGQVISFDPSTMRYKVKIPSQTLDLTPKEITRLKRNVLTKWIWTKYAEDDTELEQFYRNHRSKPRPMEGKEITTSQIVLLTQRQHENMESIAANPDRPLVQKISESGEGSWTKRVRDKMAAGMEDLTVDFTEFKWTHAAENAFGELKIHVADDFPEVGNNIKPEIIEWLLYLLPAESLDLRAWFGTDSGQKLYTCGQQPPDLRGLYSLVGAGVKCGGEPRSTNTKKECERLCATDAYCFFYTTSDAGTCKIWSQCGNIVNTVEDATVHLYRRQAICYDTSSGSWLPEAGVDHAGVNPYIVLGKRKPEYDFKADVSKFQDLFGSDKNHPRVDGGSSQKFPWFITKDGCDALEKLLTSLETVKQGTALDQETIQIILKIPGINIEEWYHASNPFVVGPNDWDSQVYKEEKQLEEFRNPKEAYVTSGGDEAQSKSKIVIFRTEENKWATGVITNAVIDHDKAHLRKDPKLGDYMYTIVQVAPDGSKLNEGTPIQNLRWQTHWFDPRGKWKNAGCEEITAYKDWEESNNVNEPTVDEVGDGEQSFNASKWATGEDSLLQVREHGVFVRQHNSRGEPTPHHRHPWKTEDPARGHP